MKYKTPEAELRKDVINKLICMGVKVKRIENSIGGRHISVPDLWFFDPVTKIAGWMELKSLKGTLSKGKDSQEEFQSLCLLCGVNHWVVRSVDEAVFATGRYKHDEKRLMEIEL